MTEGVNPTAQPTCTCGCCEGLGPETPAFVSNPPGLSAIAYRVGTHPQFKATMLAALTSKDVPALAGLDTRDDDDLSIGLVDAWATVADVLTFYQERIANESYLRTATERLSILELARLIGYELRPGVAAGASLAFSLETAKEAPVQVTIPTGTKVGSIPGPNEHPQTFETVEDIVARRELSELRPRLLQPQIVSGGSKAVVVDGLAPQVSAGDRVLIVSGGIPFLQRVFRVVPDQESKTTRLELAPNVAWTAPALQTGTFAPATPLPANTTLTASVVESAILPSSWNAADLTAQATALGWSLEELAEAIETELAKPSAASADGVYALRVKASIFGHNAPNWDTLDKPKPPSWEGRKLAAETSWKQSNEIDLDAVYPHIVAGGWAALVRPPGDSNSIVTATVNRVTEKSRADFLISGKLTSLRLSNVVGNFAALTIRGTTVYAQSEQLPLAEVPIADPVSEGEIQLDGFYLGLSAGRTLIVTGELVDAPGVVASEVVTLKEVLVEGGRMLLELETPGLANSYVRKTVKINANVAAATHGESKREAIGSGDGSKAYQRFALRQPPLTYVSAATASGVESTLRVYVDGVRWHEVESLYGHSPRDHVYVTELSDDGKTTVEFGDGQTGARLPTGSENVEARYRKGIGLEGLVKAGQLSLLTTKPLGVKSVVNPLPAQGAADPEPPDQARANAPITVLTLDRVVSDTDYEDFARSFAGIAKALATPLPGPEGTTIVLTVAGPNGATVDESGDAGKNLRKAIVGEGDVGVRFEIVPYRPVLFKLSAQVKVDPDSLPERVLPAVEQAVRSAFSFDARAFGQHVAESEVVEVMQAVPGVVAVVVTELCAPPASGTVDPRLWALVPQPGDTSVLGAQLITLDPRPLPLSEMP